jgi:hypothetical protein
VNIKSTSLLRPDGSIKEVSLTNDSYGNREKIITRIIGEKKHCVSERSDSRGYLEIEERFENFDEGYLFEIKN